METLDIEKNFSTTAGCVEGENETSPVRIWLVDDNAGFRVLLWDLLNGEEGFECPRHFASPPALLKALEHEAAPDIILLDIEMGAYNGLDAIRPIKAAAPGTHVLILTTFAQAESRARAFREGASDFMLKSWSLSEMAEHIRQAMEFGSVAGLLTAFLAQERPAAEPERLAVAGKSSRTEGWLDNVRGWFKFSPSKTF